jgi:molybdopterin-synthase adenylyltransferase
MDKRFSRQSFLGPVSMRAIVQAKVAIIGLCGGGSHVAQQLAHIGIGALRLFDHDHADETNSNRMVGLGREAAKAEMPKTEVMESLVRNVNPDCDLRLYPHRWQQHHEELRTCTAVVGCVDSYAQRDELERYSRRYMVPYIDVGMSVSGSEGRHLVSGQVILSMPGHICMQCLGFITPERLALEADNYGAAGGRPQVIWPNGVLASTAVGKVMSLITPWSEGLRPPLCTEYDGNRMTLSPSHKLAALAGVQCPHYAGNNSVGD